MKRLAFRAIVGVDCAAMAGVTERLKAVLAHERRGDHAKALTIFEAVLTSDPDRPDAHHPMGLPLRAARRRAKPGEPTFHTMRAGPR